MIIKKYTRDDESALLQELEIEGWDCYCSPNIKETYKEALFKSITYVAYEDESLCGYCRAVNDNGIYIYISDLLVVKRFRGRKTAQHLMERICEDFPDLTVYVLSDEDLFYQKKGYQRAGSIYEVQIQED